MTVALAVKCSDGIVLACDSLATFARGVPVAKYGNKAHTIDHELLLQPVAVAGAGTMAFIDKFVDRSERVLSGWKKDGKVTTKLDIVDYVERVGETVGSILFKEYVIDRYKFFGTEISNFSLSLIATGATKNGDLRAYFIHQTGLAEAISDYGTIGSGAAYAELFLKNLIQDPSGVTVDEAAPLAVYAIKGVEIMDPYVGGDTGVILLRMKDGKLRIEKLPQNKIPKNAYQRMEDVLKKMGNDMRGVIDKPKPRRRS